MAKFDRTATAVWQGAGKDGMGRLSTASGVLKDAGYAADMRFGDRPGTNPEELIAAAHAGCYAMALSFALQRAGFTSEKLEASATVTVEQSDKGFDITRSALTVKATVPGISKEKFMEAAEGAKAGCPVSKALKVDITLDASLA